MQVNLFEKIKKIKLNFWVKLSQLLLQTPYSFPSVDDYYGEYPLHWNFTGEIFHGGGFPMPSPGLVRRLLFLTKMKIVVTKARLDPE